MKKTFALVVALALFVGISSAQKLPGKSAAAAGGGASGVAAGGVGMTWIDGQAYYLVNVAPEIAFGKFGAGLDLNLYVSSKDQSIRWQEYSADVLSVTFATETKEMNFIFVLEC